MEFKQYFNNPIVLDERKSLDVKNEFVKTCYEDIRQKLLNNDFYICNSFNTIFGTFTGINVSGKYIPEFKYSIEYYLGAAGDLRGAKGKAEIKKDSSNKGFIFVEFGPIFNNYAIFYYNNDVMADNTKIHYKNIDPNILKQFTPNSFEKNIPTGEDLLFDISSDTKTSFAHEMTHIYDLIQHGMKDYSDDKKWHQRQGEVEAELVTLYNHILENLNQYKSSKEFSDKFPLTYDGLSKMVNHSDYDSHIIPMISQSDNPQKIYRRLVDIRQKVIEVLNKA